VVQSPLHKTEDAGIEETSLISLLLLLCLHQRRVIRYPAFILRAHAFSLEGQLLFAKNENVIKLRCSCNVFVVSFFLFFFLLFWHWRDPDKFLQDDVARCIYFLILHASIAHSSFELES
jgi:hypothetical protein